jgi:glycosyltransferase involved in cell wall biosynthesis
MRIGVDARTFLDSKPRGEGRAGLRLYEELARLKSAWSVTLYGDTARTELPPQLPRAGIRSHAVPGFRWNTWVRFALPAMASFDRVDVLHCTSSEAPRWSPAPMVVTVHDLIPLLFDDGAAPAEAARFRRGIESTVERAAAIIAVSESTRQDLIRHAGARAERVHVVHWGSDAPPPGAPPEVRRVALAGLGIERPYLLAFGGGAPRKNTLGVVRGFSSIARRLPELDLVLVGLGRGPVRDKVAHLAGQLCVTERVRALQYTDDATLEHLFSGARALLYLSLYEGFGLPVLEAMARGLPVLASDRSSIPEVAGHAALLLDPDDEAGWPERAASTLANQAELAAMAAAGRLRAEQFSWRRTAERTAEILERAAG